MKNNILISVVTASLNQGLYIENCVKSVFNQNSNFVEHVIIDGNSVDSTREIMKKFASYSNVIFISEPDAGQSSAFNKGVKIAKGDWILWLNADDELYPGVIDCYLKAIKKFPESNFFYGSVNFVDEHGVFLKQLISIPLKKNIVKNFLYTPSTSGSLFKRELLLKYPLDETFHYSMDSKWFIENFERLVPKMLYVKTTKFRLSPKSKTANAILRGIKNERQIYETNALFSLYVGSKKNKLTLVYIKISKLYYYILKAYSLIMHRIRKLFYAQ